MKKKLTAVLLLLCLFASMVFPAAPARAESYTVYVKDNTLKVYSRVSTSAKVLGTMAYGESMVCLAVNSSWAAVKNSAGKIGYCKVNGLSVSNPNVYSKAAYITANNVPVYRKPDTDSSVMMKLNKNESYTAVAVTADGKWARLKNGKYYGYVQMDYLSASAVQNNSGTQAGLNTTVYITATTLKAYQAASSSSKLLGTMSFGESMTLLAVSGSWARIRNSAGAVGYCKLSGLSASNPCTISEKVYINANGVKVYRKPSTSAGTMQILKLNESYTAVGMTADGSWVRLKNGRYYGYVQSKYISNLKIEEETEEEAAEETVYASAGILNIYKSADENAGLLTTIAYGESAVLVSVDDGWAQLRLSGGKTGYCLYGGITKTDPNTMKKTMYAVQDGVQLLKQPHESSAAIKTINTNAAVSLIAVTEDNIWARLNLGGGSYAYVQLEKLSETMVARDDGSIQPMDAATMYIASTTLTVYAENSASAAVLGTMSFGETLTCTGQGDGWARVMNSSADVGYCKLSGLTYTNPNTGSVTMYAQAADVKVYQKASASSSVLSTLGLNAKVTAVAASEDKTWLRLKTGSGYGYAKASYFATTAVQSSAASSKIEKVIALAKQQIGIDYVYAAQSPSTGFDCSGFTYYVFKEAAGIRLKRTAKTQGYSNDYPKITSRSDLKAGDLVFFNTVDDGADDLCDHVGIYLGSNKFIHASSAKDEVTISDLGKSSRDYYYRTWSWGMRIIR